MFFDVEAEFQDDHLSISDAPSEANTLFNYDYHNKIIKKHKQPIEELFEEKVIEDSQASYEFLNYQSCETNINYIYTKYQDVINVKIDKYTHKYVLKEAKEFILQLIERRLLALGQVLE